MPGPSSTPPAEAPAIRALGLSKSFPARGEERGRRGESARQSPEGIEDIDLEIPKGRLVALAGPNGSGKTTLLRVLAGDLTPDSGEAHVLGVPAVGRSADLRARVVYLSQSLALDPEMNPLETLRLFAALGGLSRKGRDARLREVASSFGLEKHLDKRVGRLSGGLKRRLHLAVAFLGEPVVFLFDEPTAGLDAEGRKFLWKALAKRCSAGGCALVATHDVEEATPYADEIVRLERGRIVKARSK